MESRGPAAVSGIARGKFNVLQSACNLISVHCLVSPAHGAIAELAYGQRLRKTQNAVILSEAKNLSCFSSRVNSKRDSSLRSEMTKRDIFRQPVKPHPESAPNGMAEAVPYKDFAHRCRNWRMASPTSRLASLSRSVWRRSHFFLALGQGQLALGDALAEVDAQGDERQALLVQFCGQACRSAALCSRSLRDRSGP